MIALLRYAVLRSSRESLLYALLFGPSAMLTSPILVTATYLFLTGHGIYPMSMTSLTPAANARLVGEIGRFLCSLSAGFAGFAIFRQEMANRSLGFFLLAVRPRAIILAATIYGVIAALAGLLLLVAGVAALTAAWPPYTPALLGTLICSAVVSGALGALIASISPDPTMLVATAVGSLAVTMVLERWPTPPTMVLFLATGGILIAVSSTILRRRCTI